MDIITDNLDIWTSAIKTRSSAGRGSSKKLDLYGIKKLRELILELAVRGKLVPQDPNDEPASVLLERIAAEKAQLVKEKKIKKPKNLSEITEEEMPFELPNGWSIGRLGTLSHVITKGTTPTSLGFSFTESGVNFIKVENVSKGRISLTAISQYISEKTNEALIRSSLLANDVLFSIAGTIGKTCLVCPEDLPANTNQALAIIRGTSSVFVPRYLMIQLDSYVSAKTKEKARGGAMPNVSLGDLTNLVSIIPPLSEQHRIVEKVDELMALCDQLEQQTESSIEAHATLVESLLTTLTSSADAAELQQNWTRLADHFDTLFTTEQSIDQLKQTVLQLAVMGKLVPQDPNDEPAAVLLEKIAAEKAQLIKDKKIKKQKPLPPITEDEKPFPLPEGWEWTNLADIFAMVTDGDHQAPPKAEQGIPFLVIGNLNTGEVKFDDCKYVPESYYAKLDWGRRPVFGDILYTVTGSYGIPVRVETNREFCVQRHVAILKKAEATPREYLRHALRSEFSLNYASAVATGIAQKTVPLTGLRKMPMAIPPLAEQHRIVAKVDQLMALCDQLKTRLQQAQQTQLHLADALVEEALNG